MKPRLGVLRHRRAALTQVGRFVVVGLANTAATYIVLWFLHAKFGVAVGIASATGYVIGAVQGFVLNRYWTFAHPTPGAVAPQMLGFVMVNMVCAALFARGVVLLDKWLPLPLATLAATALVIPVSFALYRWLVFRHRREV